MQGQQEYTTKPGLNNAGDGTQGLMHTREALYQRSYRASLELFSVYALLKTCLDELFNFGHQLYN